LLIFLPLTTRAGKDRNKKGATAGDGDDSGDKFSFLLIGEIIGFGEYRLFGTAVPARPGLKGMLGAGISSPPGISPNEKDIVACAQCRFVLECIYAARRKPSDFQSRSLLFSHPADHPRKLQEIEASSGGPAAAPKKRAKIIDARIGGLDNAAVPPASEALFAALLTRNSLSSRAGATAPRRDSESGGTGPGSDSEADGEESG